MTARSSGGLIRRVVIEVGVQGRECCRRRAEGKGGGESAAPDGPGFVFGQGEKSAAKHHGRAKDEGERLNTCA